MKVLMPIDFSHENLNQLKFLSLLQIQDVKPTLLHVIQTGFFKGNQDALAEDSKLKLEKLATHELLSHSVVNSFVEITNKSKGTFISEFAENHDFDLILLSVKQRSEFESLLLNSELFKIIRSSNVPILCIPSHFKQELKEACFATDFSDGSAKGFIDLFPITQNLKLKTHFFKVNTPTDFLSNKEFLATSFNFGKIIPRDIQTDFSLWSDYSIEEGIINFAQVNQIQLIVVVTHGRTGINLLINGSVTDGLLQLTHLPILIHNIKE